MGNYISKIRSKLGKDKFIHPAARIIIENEAQQILFIMKKNGSLGLPAGAFEENETIEECIIREVKEETGLDIKSLEVIGISSNPVNETVHYSNGDIIQYFTIEFYSNHWEGTIDVIDKKEIKFAKFLNISFRKDIPENEQSAFESLEYFRKNNQIMLK